MTDIIFDISIAIRTAFSEQGFASRFTSQTPFRIAIIGSEGGHRREEIMNEAKLRLTSDGRQIVFELVTVPERAAV